MPHHGPSLSDSASVIARLDAESRRFIASSAARRASLELKGASAFTAVTQALIELRADLRIVELSARAIAEEIDHSGIYLAFARAYSTDDVPAPRPEPIDLPVYPGVGDDGQRLLRAIGMCSINETMACSFLELCLEGATVAPIREGLRCVLEDEVRHARIGWACLGSPLVGDAERRLVSDWLMPMLRAQWQGWSDQIATLPEGERAEHGCPSAGAIERASRASVLDLVLPGFARAGVDVSRATAWFERAAEPPTIVARDRT
jgi:D-serine deaminase-like pyridoxal phosphate-dependent protein